MKWIDLSYYIYPPEYKAANIFKNERAANSYQHFLAKKNDVIVVRRTGFDETVHEHGVQTRFFNASSRSDLKEIHQFILDQKPDVVLVQGLIYYNEIRKLYNTLEGNSKILVQHHGELPYTGIKGWLQKRALKKANGFLFTAAGNAQAWRDTSIIKNEQPVFEIPEAGTWFQKQDHRESRQKTGIKGSCNFLWVGRLNQNKDPITVLNGFRFLLTYQPEAHLYLIFQDNTLLPKVKDIIENSPLLSNRVSPIGKVAHEELPYWYSAADFYVSGSHREGSGYALIEAMSCGCTPIVTSIPAFRVLTGDGRVGYLYEPGNDIQLTNAMKQAVEEKSDDQQQKQLEFVQAHLSFEAIAGKMAEAGEKILTIK
jgi:glycosyltransferase involved in cell wall biosynthesis